MGKKDSEDGDGAIFPNELKYKLAFIACLETKKLKENVGRKRNNGVFVDKHLVLPYVKAIFQKEGLLQPKHMVVKGRQERWLKKLEFALGDVMTAGWFIKDAGEWTTTAAFDRVCEKLTAESFMKEVMQRMAASDLSDKADGKTLDEHFMKVGYKEFDPKNDADMAILYAAKAKGKVKFLIQME